MEKDRQNSARPFQEYRKDVPIYTLAFGILRPIYRRSFASLFPDLRATPFDAFQMPETIRGVVFSDVFNPIHKLLLFVLGEGGEGGNEENRGERARAKHGETSRRADCGLLSKSRSWTISVNTGL